MICKKPPSFGILCKLPPIGWCVLVLFGRCDSDWHQVPLALRDVIGGDGGAGVEQLGVGRDLLRRPASVSTAPFAYFGPMPTASTGQ